MFSRDMDSSLDNGDRSERSAQLVYPIDESPIPRFDKERKLLEYSTQESILEDESVRGCNSLLESEKPNVSPPRCGRPRRLVFG